MNDFLIFIIFFIFAIIGLYIEYKFSGTKDSFWKYSSKKNKNSNNFSSNSDFGDSSDGGND